MARLALTESGELPPILYSPKPYAQFTLRFSPAHPATTFPLSYSNFPPPQIIRFCLPELSLHLFSNCLLPISLSSNRNCHSEISLRQLLFRKTILLYHRFTKPSTQIP